MKLGEWTLGRLFGGLIERRVESEVAERLQAASALPAARQREDEGYRRMGDTRRDLTPMTHARSIEVAHFLWQHNPLARRILELYSEWIVGEGVKVSAPDPRTKELLDSFISDPVNRLRRRLPEKCRELFLFGEQAWPAFVNPYSGILRMGVLDPAQIKEVITDPGNATVPIGIITRGRGFGDEMRLRTLVLGADEEVLSPAALRERERFNDGELLFFGINKLSTAKRGVSELFALADSLDGYEQLLFAMLARNRAMASYFWDYKLEGFTQDEIDEYMARITPPRPFSNFGHNEKVERKLVGPEFGSAENDSSSARLQRNHVLGAVGVGEHHYGGGGDVNRSTSGSMDEGMAKSMGARQRVFGATIEDTLATQIELGVRVGRLRDTPEAREFSLSWPDLSTRDISRVGQALQAVAGAVTLLRDEGLVSEEVGAQFVGALGSHIGVEIDAAQMLEQAREQRAGRLADDVSRHLERGAGRA